MGSPNATESLQAFQLTIFHRNRRELVVAIAIEVLLLASLGTKLWLGESVGPGTWLGMGAMTAALTLIVLVLARFGAPAAGVARDAKLDAISLRAERVRQARLLMWAPLWYALPIAVGASALLHGRMTDLGRDGALWPHLVVWGGCAVVAGLNVRAARGLRRQPLAA